MSEMRQAIQTAAIGATQAPAAGTLLRSFAFPPGFPGFAGHFPGFPIVPAVVQILTALTLAEELHGGRLRLVGVEHAKFQLQLRPLEEIAVQVRERLSGDRLAFEAKLHRGGENAAAFTLIVAAGEET